MPDMTIAVLGATGRTGRPLVAALERVGARVHPISRTPDRVGVFPEQTECRFGDMQDIDSLVTAFHGASSIHYIPPSLDARDPEYVGNIIIAAEKAGVSRVVYHSVLHSNTPEMPHHIRKAGCERLFRNSSLRWTVIQPAMYVQTALAYFDPTADLLLPPYNPGQPFTLIHERDLAEAAAIIHTTDGHDFATYELAGTERLNFVAMADQLSVLLDRPITAQQVDAKTYVAKFAMRRGLSESQAHERWAMFDYYDRHGLPGNGNTLRMILGRDPTPFIDAVRGAIS